MPTVSASTEINASPEEAFDFISDYRNIPRLQPHFTAVRLVGEKDRQVGAEVELEGKFHGMPVKTRERIIAYDRPHRMVTISEGTVTSRSTWVIEQLQADPQKIRVGLTLDFKLGGSLGGLFTGIGSLVGSLFQREIQTMTNDSLHRLKAFLEKAET